MAIFVSLLAIFAMVVVSMLMFMGVIDVLTFSIGMAVIIVVWPVVLYKKGAQILADKQSDIWDTIDAHLKEQGFAPASKIEVCGEVESAKKPRKLPALIISVDMDSKRFAFTRYKDERLVTEFLAFDVIKNGEIMIGGKSNTTSGIAAGGARYGLAAGISTSETYSVVHSMEYRFTTTDVLNPFYMVTIFNREVYESAPIYRHYLDAISKLDIIVKSILEKKEEA